MKRLRRFISEDKCGKNYTSCSFFGRTAPEAAVREFVNLKALFGFLKRCSFTLLREKGNSNKNKPLTNTF